MDDVTLLHGDCLSILPTLEAGSVDAVVTDPPYGTGEWQRPESGLGKVPKATFKRAEWDVWDISWIDQALRVSRGPVLFFLPIKELASGIEYAKATGEPWRLAAWCKSDPMPTFTGQPAFGLDPVMILRSKLIKGSRDWCEASSPKQLTGKDRRDHPHQKPLKVMRWLCEMAASHGKTILDPYAGSGTTLVACMKTGRRCIGIEIDPDYIPIIERRVKTAETPLFQGLGVDILGE